MKLAEAVTFGGGGVDRAAELRGDAAGLAAVSGGEAPAVLPLWRGKPLMQDGPDGPCLCFLPGTHPILADAPPSRLFLGRVEGALRFAADVSRWEPDTLDQDALDSYADDSRQVPPSAPEASYRELRLTMAGLSRRDAELAATAKAMLGWHRSHRFCARCGTESLFEHGGWHRRCPECGGMHFPRTDPVVIMLITHGNDLLIGRSPGWPEGMYSLLAGFVEPGETLEAAVRREVAEETNVSVGPVAYLSSQPWPYPSSLMFGCIGEARSREITLDPVELEDAFWISREDLALALAGHHPTLLPAREGAIARFLMENWLADRLD